MDNQDFVRNAVRYAQSHLDEQALDLQTIANASGFSLDYFNRLFSSQTGFTVMAYVSYIRLKKAAHLLRNTDKSILDIALDIGYESQEGFAKAFKKQYSLSPNEYRKSNRNTPVAYGELVDESVANRFLFEHPELKAVNPDEVIEYLLEKDARRYGRVCGEIKYMGLAVAAPQGDYARGVVCIGDNRNDEYYLELVTDDRELLADWLGRFRGNASVFSMMEEEEAEKYFGSLDMKVKCMNILAYAGQQSEIHVPESISIRKITDSDVEHVRKWAGNRKDPYTVHLLTPEHYSDESVLEYGVFEQGELIAVAGCGVDTVLGLKMNDCCIIRFAEGKEQQALYRTIYNYVTEDMYKNGIIPFDTLQYGEYAMAHGGFTSADVGYEIVNRKYTVI